MSKVISALASLLNVSYSEDISSNYADRLREKAAEARAEYDSMQSELRRLRAVERAYKRVAPLLGTTTHGDAASILAEELARK